MTPRLEQLIAGVAELEISELETFVGQANLLLARRKTAAPSIQETELLQTINRSLPADITSRYSALRDKVHNETITSAEHAELMKLVDVTEQADAKRLEALVSLSQIRQIPLAELMAQLGICPPPIRG